jgi:hypothetical protein
VVPKPPLLLPVENDSLTTLTRVVEDSLDQLGMELAARDVLVSASEVVESWRLRRENPLFPANWRRLVKASRQADRERRPRD